MSCDQLGDENYIFHRTWGGMQYAVDGDIKNGFFYGLGQRTGLAGFRTYHTWFIISVNDGNGASEAAHFPGKHSYAGAVAVREEDDIDNPAKGGVFVVSYEKAGFEGCASIAPSLKPRGTTWVFGRKPFSIQPSGAPIGSEMAIHAENSCGLKLNTAYVMSIYTSSDTKQKPYNRDKFKNNVYTEILSDAVARAYEFSVVKSPPGQEKKDGGKAGDPNPKKSQIIKIVEIVGITVAVAAVCAAAAVAVIMMVKKKRAPPMYPPPMYPPPY